jgi:hypothetical protein
VKWSKETHNKGTMVKILRDLANMLQDAQEHRTALDWAEEALRLQESETGVDSLATAELLIKIGNLTANSVAPSTSKEQMLLQ